MDALSKLDKLGPAHLQNDLVDWNTEQGLLLYRGHVYVPKDDALRAEIVCIHHDLDRKSTRLNSSHSGESRMPSSA